MPDLTFGDVAEIKSFLSRTCDGVLSSLPGTGWQPPWQSEAAGELASSEVHADGSAWGEVPVRTACAAAVFLLTAADCLRAMADRVNVLITTYTSGVLARAASSASTPNSSRNSGATILARADPAAAFRHCCHATGRFDGAPARYDVRGSDH